MMMITTKKKKNNNNKKKTKKTKKNNNNNNSWTRVGTFTWCPTKCHHVATFEPNQPIDQAALWKAQTTDPPILTTPFSLAEDAHPALHLRSLLLRASDVEVNPGSVCRGCTKTIRRDITPIICSSCSQPYHRT